MSIYPSGTRIAGRYEVAGRPLLGGMGIVYLCMDHVEERPVALKTFRPEYLPDRSARDRFLREGTTWVDLGRHPNIVRCYSIDRIGDGREIYLALEMVAKPEDRQDASLRSWLTPGQPLPLEQALLFALQIVRGLRHATDAFPGFVHRDLKPENVLVGADRLSSLETNRLRVTDFGLANFLQATGISEKITTLDSSHLLVDSSPSIIRTQLTHGIVGTPLYMAPEQWRGEELGVYTDVYALGCILVEMLTGKRPVPGDTISALEQAHCGGQLQAMPANQPESVSSLLERCLRLIPGERYTAWEELESAFGEAWEQINNWELHPEESSNQLDREERISVGWSYSSLGASYVDIGKADVAREYFERAQAVGEAEGELRLKAAGLTHVGTTYQKLGDAHRAISFYEQALIIDREIEDRWGAGISLCNMGVAYLNLGDAHRAIGFFEQALEITRQFGNRHGEATNLSNLGNAYANLGNIHQAISFYEQALIIAREIGNLRIEGIILSGLGNSHLNLGDIRQAIGFFEQHLAISREIGDRGEEGNALGNLGNAYSNLGDARRAIGFFEQHLAISREIGDRRGEGADLCNLGNANFQLGDTRQAVGFYEQALIIAREIGDQRMESFALGNLGNASLSLGDSYRAISYHEQCLAISREIGDQRGEGCALGNLGNACRNLGDARRAINYHEQALAISREIGDRHGEGNDLCGLGNSYLTLGDTRQAIGFFEQALEMTREIGDITGVATVSFNMANLYAQEGESQKALSLAQEAAHLFIQIGNTQNAQRAQQLVAKLQG